LASVHWSPWIRRARKCWMAANREALGSFGVHIQLKI
jgi:hypothetical protein